ncbi:MULTISPECIES: heavy-metal-associated domain-containing protein [Arenibacter]|uniref:heavy-metal-associated domain-containing protein n=1 Tax=Arenibacter TaxID=178469 RepID=UPI001C0659E7|nr:MULTISPECIES: heavy-metal-associated domain-containing protein [Arenibacter]MBU2906268.1 heavy-metal-associated domain-containing protein [Arenibacter algicola]MCK0135137.1 heavy-metal-associated domain-containing protein [Arenibacter sp. S6351L]
MSILSENVIPGNHGKVFGTNAKEANDLRRIKENLLKIEGVKNVIFNDDFPVEFTVHTTKMVEIKDIEKMVKGVGFHAIPKGLFSL